MSTQKTILITGAGSGFGLLTAKTLAKAGHTVFASMRGTQGKNQQVVREIEAWATHERANLSALELDILDDASIESAVKSVINQAGQVDVLINNAGMLVAGITECFTPEQVLAVFNTNVVGVIRVNRAVLPYMRHQRSGLIVYVGSVTSNIISPFQGPYVASKAAEDKIAETTHYEVSRYGVDSVIVQPGAYTAGTKHFPNAQKPADTARVEEYTLIADLPQQLVERLNALVAEGGEADPQDVADAILGVIETPPGQRPFRVVVDPQHHGAEPINEVTERMQTQFMERFGIKDLMTVSTQPTQ